ncbi:MAG: GyrI-like domain-containing protein [Puia sp.]|nr:GyrI-like domain-containing protein [Puia sp.]
MMTKPIVRHRVERPYVAVCSKVDMGDIPTVLPTLIPILMDWLGSKAVAPAGPPFFQYLSMDRQGLLLVAVGVPIVSGVQFEDGENGAAIGVAPGWVGSGNSGRILGWDDSFLYGVLPAGSYVCVTHTGGYACLGEVHQSLEEWMEKEDWTDRHRSADGAIHWRCRVESYITDPQTVPDPGDWRTDVEFLIAYEGEYGSRKFFEYRSGVDPLFGTQTFYGIHERRPDRLKADG